MDVGRDQVLFFGKNRVWCFLLLSEFLPASTDTAPLILTSCTAAVVASLAFQDVGRSRIVWFATHRSLLPQAVGLQPKPILFPCTACLGKKNLGASSGNGA